MKPLSKATKGVLLGLAGGTAWYLIGESAIPTDANCTYLASPWTDVLVVGLGAVSLRQAYKKDEALYGFIGSSIMAIHALQFVCHKGIDSFRHDPCGDRALTVEEGDGRRQGNIAGAQEDLR